MGSSLSSLNPMTHIDQKMDKMIFFPPQIEHSLYYSMLNTHRSLLLDFKTINGKKISAVQVRPQNNVFPDRYIVYSHGNGSDILTMFDYFQMLADDLNVCVFGYDYIGYGLSENELPTEQGCYESLESVMDFLLHIWKINPKKILLIGQSLGTGITIDYVSKYEWNVPIILISPYKSICKVVMDTSCVRPIDKFRSQSKLKKVSCPIKIFHGDADDVINIKHGKELYNSLQNKHFAPTWLEGIGHNNILLKIKTDDYMEVINAM